MRARMNTIATVIAVAGLASALATALAAGPTLAQPSQAAPTTVVRDGDDALTCRQLADEAATLSADMGETGPGLLGRVGGVARAGATLLAPVAGLAVAGAEALTNSGKQKREAEADTRRDRWNYLNGLYAGRSCGETAAQPVSTTVAPPQSPAIAVAPPVAAPHVAAPAAAPAPTITPAAFPH